MANTKIRLIIFFAAKDGEALYSQEKQDQDLTVAQIMNSLLHWPGHRASVPISRSMKGLSSRPAMEPCFGSFPKQHPRTHVVPPPPQTQQRSGHRVPALNQGKPALPLKVSPPLISNRDPQLIGNPWRAHRAGLYTHTHTHPGKRTKTPKLRNPPA